MIILFILIAKQLISVDNLRRIYKLINWLGLKGLKLMCIPHLQIDILINNAGRAQCGWTKDTPVEVDRAVFDLNIVGPISHTKAVLPHMLERGQGMISTVSSVLGKFGRMMSKSAVFNGPY